jgi:hypothetical protein
MVTSVNHGKTLFLILFKCICQKSNKFNPVLEPSFITTADRKPHLVGVLAQFNTIYGSGKDFLKKDIGGFIPMLLAGLCPGFSLEKGQIRTGGMTRDDYGRRARDVLGGDTCALEFILQVRRGRARQPPDGLLLCCSVSRQAVGQGRVKSILCAGGCMFIRQGRGHKYRVRR